MTIHHISNEIENEIIGNITYGPSTMKKKYGIVGYKGPKHKIKPKIGIPWFLGIL